MFFLVRIRRKRTTTFKWVHRWISPVLWRGCKRSALIHASLYTTLQHTRFIYYAPIASHIPSGLTIIEAFFRLSCCYSFVITLNYVSQMLLTTNGCTTCIKWHSLRFHLMRDITCHQIHRIRLHHSNLMLVCYMHPFQTPRIWKKH